MTAQYFFLFFIIKIRDPFFSSFILFLIIHELLIFRMRMNVNEGALDLNVDVNDSKIHHKELCNIITTLIIYMYWLVFQKNPPTTILLKLLLFLPKKKKWEMLVCEWYNIECKLYTGLYFVFTYIPYN